MALEQKDLELIERIVYKSGDDTAVSIARSFERLEERIDAAESRIYRAPHSCRCPMNVVSLSDSIQTSPYSANDFQPHGRAVFTTRPCGMPANGFYEPAW